MGELRKPAHDGVMGDYAVPLGWKLAIWPAVLLIIAFNVLLLIQVPAPSSE